MPLDHLHDLAESHRRLLESVATLTENELRMPSRLPGWARDMLIGHLGSGAEAAARAGAGAVAGSSTVMYPGGEQQRDEEIASAAGRPGPLLLDQLRDACRRVEDVFSSVPDSGAECAIETRRGPVSLRDVLLQRWLDVEAHHVDLDLGYETSRWPQGLVDAYLPGLVQVLPALRARPDADRSVVGSWAIHRTDAPGDWAIEAHTTGARLGEVVGEADCRVEGAGRDLMAWLLGRPTTAVRTTGDQRWLPAFKRAFPGPVKDPPGCQPDDRPARSTRSN